MAERIITLFGEPAVTVDGKPVKLGVALPLLILLILWRHRDPISVEEVVERLHKEQDEAMDVAQVGKESKGHSFLRKRKGTLLTKLGLDTSINRTLAQTAQELTAQAWIDVVQFDLKIGSTDSEQVLEAIALRQRGPLLAQEEKLDIVASARATREKKYQRALQRTLQEVRTSLPQEAVQKIDWLLGCDGLPEESIAFLHEQRLAREHEIFREDREAGGSKTTRLLRPLKLPSSPTTLVGRDAERGTVQKLLADASLVTLTGTAGIGKTRLALALASSLQENFPAGAGFADLTSVTDASQLPQQIGKCLGLKEEKDFSWHDTLLAFLEHKEMLLVWDNCEHLVQACADLAAEVLVQCPTVRILATSREPLGVYGESRYQVPTLPLPDAVQLFSARAKAVRSEFCLTEKNGPVITEICRDLDCLPLAIEIAASLADVKAVSQIAVDLHRRFDLLAHGPRAGAPRHRSLKATFDVSYAVLQPAEQTLFRRLGVFPGSFNADAVQALAFDRNGSSEDISSLLSPLIRKSLVTAEPFGEEMRYHLLVTTRQYAQNRMQEQGEWDNICQQHRDFYRRMAEEAEPHLKGPEPTSWLDRLETEIANLRAALEWRTDEISARLLCALPRFWLVRGHQQEARRWLKCCAETGEDVSDHLRVRAFNGAGSLAFALGDFQDARRLHEKGLALAQQTGNNTGIAESLNYLGGVTAHQDNYDEAMILIEKSLLLWRQAGDKEGIAQSLNYRGMVANYQCDYEKAKSSLEESLAILRPLNDTRSVASGLYNLGIIAYYQCDYTTAQELFAESLTLWRPLGDKYSIAKSLNGLGEVALYQDDFKAAQEIYAESLILRQQFGDKYGIANSLNGLGQAALLQNDGDAAQKLFEESLELRRQIGDQQSVPHSLHNLGKVALHLNDHAAARRLLLESLALMRQNEDRYGIAHSLEALAAVSTSPEHAVRLLSAADALRLAIHSPRSPREQAEYDSQVAGAKMALPSAIFELAWAEGQAMTWEEAVAYVLGETEDQSK